jgi:hypothetical protein
MRSPPKGDNDVRPRGGYSELRQYAADEWHADHLYLVSEMEKRAVEEKRIEKEKKREGKISRALNFLISLKRGDNRSANRK